MIITRSKKRKGDIFVELNFTPKKRKSKPHVITENIVDRNLELTDLAPNIHHLFKSFDDRYFAGLLSKNNVIVIWGKSYGIRAVELCTFYETMEENEKNRIIIELNDLLLKFRTRRDLVETLLHEMIHAYLSITINGICASHGPNFLKEMDRINAETGANVTVHHDYLNELALYENRLWRCNGNCRNRPPQFGIIRIKTDHPIDFEDQWWWSYHLKNCGGNFELVRRPM